jgi:A/G-specific adenine glycosylase
MSSTRKTGMVAESPPLFGAVDLDGSGEGPYFDRELFLARGGEGHVAAFRALVMGHYAKSGRAFPWRETQDPWAILVSEIMLQQTQTERVVPKYEAFLAAFPRPAELAAAPLSSLLALWSGLGYNRRALALKRSAQEIVERHGGKLPKSAEELDALPGVGPYTARAVMAFAFGEPSVFIETNIRSVYLYHFFPGEEKVADKLLEPLIARSLDSRDPRSWYYALMDYGAALKKRIGNPNRRSAQYARQSPFEDSHRRIRGAVLRELSARGAAGLSRDELAAHLPFARERVDKAIGELVAEGFVAERAGALHIA